MSHEYSQELQHRCDELALEYLPAVRAMAFKLKERLPSSVDFMDLSAIGTEELIKLARRYDESLNDSFWGYAKKRVYGSMLDYLRSLDIVSRADRKLIKAIDYAIEEYLVIHNEEPSNEELAEILGESVEAINDARVASSIYIVMPLDDQLNSQDSNTVLEAIEQDDLIDKIKTVLDGYNQKEQMVIQLYYFEELSLKEIAQIMDITESRVSQIHKNVILKIRQSLGEQNG